MKKVKGYDEAKTYSESREKLPIGGYILKILNVDYVTYDWGDQIVLSFDIAEGDYKDFFRKDYAAKEDENKKWSGTYRLRAPRDEDGEPDWILRRFKTVISAFEDSNSGFHWDWDEQKLKGKLIGGIFNNKEYSIDGREGFYTNCHSLVSVEKIRSQTFTIPEDTYLKNKPASSGSDSNNEWMNLPESESGSVPFD